MAAEELQALCAEWQKTLRLQDWEIAVRLVSAREFGDLSTHGDCDFHSKKKRAVIRILREEDKDPGVPCEHYRHYEAFQESNELVLVHELLHLYFAEQGCEACCHEFTIHALSLALLGLKYRHAEPKPDA